MITGKYKLEINFVGDGRVFLNYWDYMFGQDVVAEIRDGKLYQGEEYEEEISFPEYLKQLEQTISQYEKS